MQGDLRDFIVDLLESRGVTLQSIAEIVHEIQHGFRSGLSIDQCLESVEAVVAKREVQLVLLTGITLDQLAETGQLSEPLLSIVREDDPLFGVDEVLALGITNVYGSIGLTNFGYLDKTKLGIISKINKHEGGQVHTFLDDLIAGMAAAAAARMAHAADPSVTFVDENGPTPAG